MPIKKSPFDSFVIQNNTYKLSKIKLTRQHILLTNSKRRKKEIKPR